MCRCRTLWHEDDEEPPAANARWQPSSAPFAVDPSLPGTSPALCCHIRAARCAPRAAVRPAALPGPRCVCPCGGGCATAAAGGDTAAGDADDENVL